MFRSHSESNCAIEADQATDVAPAIGGGGGGGGCVGAMPVGWGTAEAERCSEEVTGPVWDCSALESTGDVVEF